MGVAGGHQRQAHPLGDIDGRFQRQPLDLEAVVLNLDEVAIAEHAVEPGGDLAGLARVASSAVLPREQRAAELARDAAAQADDPFADALPAAPCRSAACE